MTSFHLFSCLNLSKVPRTLSLEMPWLLTFSCLSTATAEPVSWISVISLLQLFWSASSAASRNTSKPSFFFFLFLGANIPIQTTTPTLPRILTLLTLFTTIDLLLQHNTTATNELLHIHSKLHNNILIHCNYIVYWKMNIEKKKFEIQFRIKTTITITLKYCSLFW